MDDATDEYGGTSDSTTHPEHIHRDHIPYPYQSLNADREVISVNDAWVDVLGWEREQVLGTWFGDFLSDQSRDKFEEIFSTITGEGKVDDVELELVRPDDTALYVSFDGWVEVDETGNISQIHCQFKDITELTQYKTFIQNSSDIILLHDETGEAKYVSPAVRREMGYDPEELVGRDPFEDVHPDDREQALESFTRILSNPDTVETEEYRIQTADDSYVWVESRGQNLRGGDGPDGILLNSRVIDERKEYERELERQNQRLEEFTSVVSHDLRNPLNVADLRLDSARNECDSEHLDAAAEALARMETLIEDLLSLARKGKSVETTERVTVSEIAENAWDNVQTHDATLAMESTHEIRADPSRLEQIFENLFRNAIEHCGRDVTVTIDDSADGFSVADDGPGIPEDEREAVFEFGFSTTEDGTGFGLSIVKEIVEAHGWEIHVTESANGGARFEITGVDIVTS